MGCWVQVAWFIQRFTTYVKGGDKRLTPPLPLDSPTSPKDWGRMRSVLRTSTARVRFRRASSRVVSHPPPSFGPLGHRQPLMDRGFTIVVAQTSNLVYGLLVPELGWERGPTGHTGPFPVPLMDYFWTSTCRPASVSHDAAALQTYPKVPDRSSSCSQFLSRQTADQAMAHTFPFVEVCYSHHRSAARRYSFAFVRLHAFSDQPIVNSAGLETRHLHFSRPFRSHGRYSSPGIVRL